MGEGRRGSKGMPKTAEETNAVTQITDQSALHRINLDLAQFHSAEVETLLLKYRHVERLIGEHAHHGSEGTFCEDLVREFLRQVLPRRFSVDTGFIRARPMEIGGETRFVSHQLDVIVQDTVDYSPLFRSNDFVVVLPDAVTAVIEVKKSLTSTDLKDSLNKLAVARYLTYHCQGPLHFSPDKRAFTGVFAFTSDEQLRPSSKLYSDTYRNRLAEIAGRIAPMFSVPDMIVVVDHEILHRGLVERFNTPFSIYHRLSRVGDLNLACQNFLFSMMEAMQLKEVFGGTWLRYSFPSNQEWTRVMPFYTPMDLYVPKEEDAS
jgi:hypothetical protein